jgi:sugar/nucleoside kinase (ribokinase family)
VLGFGAVAVDDVLFVDRYPPPDSKEPVRSKERHPGGLTGTALVAVARMGGRAGYAGVFDESELSRYAVAQLEREGVDCSGVLRREGAEPIHSVIIVVRPTGQRVIYPDASTWVPRPPEAMSDELIGGCRMLFVDHTALAGSLRAAEIARRLGIPVLGDVEGEPRPEVLALVDAIDHLIVGNEFAERVTGERDPAATVRALARGRAVCVVTHGDRGCWYLERGGEVKHFPAFHVRAVDTNGCGDVFHGTYAVCWCRGYSLDRTVEMATAAAAIKATRAGGQAGIPTWEAIEAFLASSH